VNILVTGSKGFIGKNLICALKNKGYNNIFEFDIDTEPTLLGEYCAKCDFVFHLAGINRTQNIDDFNEGNVGFTEKILILLKQNSNKCSFMYASSIQAELDNPYGNSKKEAEDLILNYGDETKAKTLIYRFPNVFGKWCNINYNSAVATFCHNTANNLPITISDRNNVLNLVYIDDLVAELINALEGKESRDKKYCFVPVTYTEKLGVIADKITNFSKCRYELTVPDQSDPLTKKLYSTYLSYLPKNGFKYPLNMKRDERGSFTEFLRTDDRGQISVNVTKPGITKGNHWHQSKNEKFLAISGEGVIRLRLWQSTEIIEINISSDILEVVEIPPGYTHSIENTGKNDLVTLIWANEPFDPDNPDTYYLEVLA